MKEPSSKPDFLGYFYVLFLQILFPNSYVIQYGKDRGLCRSL